MRHYYIWAQQIIYDILLSERFERSSNMSHQRIDFNDFIGFPLKPLPESFIPLTNIICCERKSSKWKKRARNDFPKMIMLSLKIVLKCFWELRAAILFKYKVQIRTLSQLTQGSDLMDLVQPMRLELTRSSDHYPLKVACLPIPPRLHLLSHYI